MTWMLFLTVLISKMDLNLYVYIYLAGAEFRKLSAEV